MDKNCLIVIDGLDGSGKATQTKLLVDYLKKTYTGRDIRTLSFPDYESDSSAAVRMYLKGELGDNPSDVNAYAASSFYAIDRYISFKMKWEKYYNYKAIFVADRYTTSNPIHQLTKLVTLAEKEAYLNWLEDFEYSKLEIPKPDLVIYLDMEPAVSQKLMNKRYEGHEEKKDIHEGNMVYLTTCRANALYCADVQGWCVISCDDKKNALPVEEIHEKIKAVVDDYFQKHLVSQ